jgi:2-keto-4-pentenoate hydratase/2-oxohepta-3-ene-1,7-dioic acid hydratase in catechol pathway
MNFRRDGEAETRLGIEVGDTCLDLEAARSAGAVPTPPGARIEDILRAPGGLPALEARLGDTVLAGLDAFRIPMAAVSLRSPVLHPEKVIGIGLNYHDHAREVGMEVPSEPILFGMYPNTIVDPGAPILIPALSRKIDYEAELAIVIGRRGRHIPKERALEYIAGYTIFNDVSARDLQRSDHQWIRGKSLDTFGPTGPVLVSTPELGDGDGLSIRLQLNGETMQDSNTSKLIFKVPELIAFISEAMTLVPGDIIATGTPPGVGAGRKPPVWMKAGDTVEIEIEGIGILRNPVADEPSV